MAYFTRLISVSHHFATNQPHSRNLFIKNFLNVTLGSKDREIPRFIAKETETERQSEREREGKLEKEKYVKNE